MVWNIFYFSISWEPVVIPTDFHIFQRGWSTTNQLQSFQKTLDAAAEKASYIRHRRMRRSQRQRIGCGGPLGGLGTHDITMARWISPWVWRVRIEWKRRSIQHFPDWWLTGGSPKCVASRNKVWIKQIDQTKHLSDISNQWWLMVISFINSPGSLWFNDFLPWRDFKPALRESKPAVPAAQAILGVEKLRISWYPRSS